MTNYEAARISRFYSLSLFPEILGTFSLFVFRLFLATFSSVLHICDKFTIKISMFFKLKEAVQIEMIFTLN